MGKAKQVVSETVSIVWIESYAQPDEDGDYNISVLTYGGGKPRVYDRDKYDSRLALGETEKLPYFESIVEGWAWMAANKVKQIQIPAWKASRLFER